MKMYVNFTVESKDLAKQTHELAKIIYESGNQQHILWPLLEVLHDHLEISCDIDGNNNPVGCSCNFCKAKDTIICL